MTPIPKIQKYLSSKWLFCYWNSVSHHQGHNPVVYMMYIYFILSLQCIIAQFSSMAVFGCFVRRKRLCVFWSIFFMIKAKQECFFDWFHEKIEVIGQILDGNEDSMFRDPLGLLEQNFSHLHSKLRHFRWLVHVPLFWSCHILMSSVSHMYYWPDTWQHGICWLIITHAACTHI